MGDESRYTNGLHLHKSKIDAEWRKELRRSNIRYAASAAPSRPSAAHGIVMAGIYRCACCGNALFDSVPNLIRVGWPSFWHPTAPASPHADTSHGWNVWKCCKQCSAHPHIFPTARNLPDCAFASTPHLLDKIIRKTALRPFIILFFVAFKFENIYVATAQPLRQPSRKSSDEIRHGKVDTMCGELVIISVFGGATLLLHDEAFIKETYRAVLAVLGHFAVRIYCSTRT
jgi:peptide methionine sulfoxide reductase MsrB